MSHEKFTVERRGRSWRSGCEGMWAVRSARRLCRRAMRLGGDAAVFGSDRGVGGAGR